MADNSNLRASKGIKDVFDNLVKDSSPGGKYWDEARNKQEAINDPRNKTGTPETQQQIQWRDEDWARSQESFQQANAEEQRRFDRDNDVGAAVQRAMEGGLSASSISGGAGAVTSPGDVAGPEVPAGASSVATPDTSRRGSSFLDIISGVASLVGVFSDVAKLPSVIKSAQSVTNLNKSQERLTSLSADLADATLQNQIYATHANNLETYARIDKIYSDIKATDTRLDLETFDRNLAMMAHNLNRASFDFEQSKFASEFDLSERSLADQMRRTNIAQFEADTNRLRSLAQNAKDGAITDLTKAKTITEKTVRAWLDIHNENQALFDADKRLLLNEQLEHLKQANETSEFYRALDRILNLAGKATSVYKGLGGKPPLE